MSEVRRWAHTVKWEGLQISAAYMAINHGGEYVMHADYVALAAERDALRQQRDKLAKALEDVEREHYLIRRMKNCEIQRGRGSFGIAVMSDPPALEWQAIDKELQQFVDARRAALAALADNSGKPNLPAGCKVVPVELLERLEHVTRTLVPHLQCHVDLRALLASAEGGE